MIYYPFKSDLRKRLQGLKEGQDYYLWHKPEVSVKDLVKQVDKSIVEIGGPTDLGYFFLDGVPLPSEVEITNISSNPLPHHPEAPKLAAMVDRQVDATELPYKDGSVGMFLMAAMSLSSDWWVGLADDEKDRAAPVFEKEFAIARLEMGQVAVGVLAPDNVRQAQRVKIYTEIQRTLEDGGLLFTDGGIEEIAILQHLGFELIAMLQTAEQHGTSYEFVAAKRS